MFRVYTYSGCDACRKALKWLREQGIEFENLPIRETPPTRDELQAMLTHCSGELRRLFNVSGGDYRAMNLKETLPGMSVDDAFALLERNGNLVKRPFLIGEGIGLVGFKPDVWAAQLS